MDGHEINSANPAWLRPAEAIYARDPDTMEDSAFHNHSAWISTTATV